MTLTNDSMLATARILSQTFCAHEVVGLIAALGRKRGLPDLTEAEVTDILGNAAEALADEESDYLDSLIHRYVSECGELPDADEHAEWRWTFWKRKLSDFGIA